MEAPTPTPQATVAEAEAAARRAAAALRLELAAVGPVEEPGFEELLAYVEGDLDPVAREILETRLADAPGLAAEVAAIATERYELAARRAERDRARPARASWRWAGLAALLAVALGGSWLIRQTLSGDLAAGTLPAPQAQAVGAPEARRTAVAFTAQLTDGSFESGGLAPARATAGFDFESGDLSGLSVPR